MQVTTQGRNHNPEGNIHKCLHSMVQDSFANINAYKQNTYIYIHTHIYIYMCVIYICLVQTVSNKIYIIDYNWFAFQWLLQTYSVCFLFPSMLKKGGFEVSLSHQLKGSNLVLRGVQEGEATQCWKLDCRQSWTERCSLQEQKKVMSHDSE